MDHSTFKSWLNAYGRAWESRDPRAAAELFAEDGSYQITPFVPPLSGSEAIFEYWVHVTQTEEDVRFGFEILAVNPPILAWPDGGRPLSVNRLG